jgi:hypothetical protein
MNAAAKIALPPLEFDEFNALDVLVNGEIAELAFGIRQTQHLPIPDARVLMLARLRALRSKVDAARPPEYAAAIRAARAESVCDT